MRAVWRGGGAVSSLPRFSRFLFRRVAIRHSHCRLPRPSSPMPKPDRTTASVSSLPRPPPSRAGRPDRSACIASEAIQIAIDPMNRDLHAANGTRIGRRRGAYSTVHARAGPPLTHTRQARSRPSSGRTSACAPQGVRTTAGQPAGSQEGARTQGVRDGDRAMRTGLDEHELRAQASRTPEAGKPARGRGGRLEPLLRCCEEAEHPATTRHRA